MDTHAIDEYDSLLVKIAEYIYHGDISKDDHAFNVAKFSLLDALGCASESLATNVDVHKLIGHYVPGTVVPKGFRLPGTSLTLDPVKGAFDLSVLIRYLDHNDGFTGLEWGHPSGTFDAMIQKPPMICLALVLILRRYLRRDLCRGGLCLAIGKEIDHD